MATVTNGNCYLCGETLSKTAMKNHLLKTHGVCDAGQECYLLKIEDAYNKDYWLYVDVARTASLSSLDTFLRKIWLECCGHLSAFFPPGEQFQSSIGKARKWEILDVGEQIGYMYDFGSTTDLLITVAGETTRPAQKGHIRLLARNVPPVFQCMDCEKPASLFCAECSYDSDNPFLCDSCAEEHDHDESFMLPVTNSPRMGVCGYDGELDVFEFKSGKLK